MRIFPPVREGEIPWWGLEGAGLVVFPSLEVWVIQLRSRFNGFAKLMNFDIAVTGLNYVYERLVKTDCFFH